MRFFTLFTIFTFLHSAGLFAQDEDFLRYRQSELAISSLIKKAALSVHDTEKLAYNDSVADLVAKVLAEKKSFEFPFDSLRTVGKIYAPDKSFRIISWNLPLTDGTYLYKSFMQLFHPKTAHFKVITLHDKSGEITNPENSVLSASKWYGALYYKILINKADTRTYYTLLGLRYHDLFISRKVIEILYFDQFGNPVFGAPIIQEGNKVKHRVLFNFSARVNMSLKYNDLLSMIVCDHLAPAESKYTGMYDYYGPDFSYDGYEFVKGRWILRTDLDIKNPEPSKVPAKKSKPGSSRISPVR